MDSFCDASNINPVVKLTGYVNVTAGSESALQYAVGTYGPVSVAIDAAHEEFEVRVLILSGILLSVSSIAVVFTTIQSAIRT